MSKQPANDFDAYEIEQAAERTKTFDPEAFKKKSELEQIKHDAGIGVETEPQNDDGDEEEE